MRKSKTKPTEVSTEPVAQSIQSGPELVSGKLVDRSYEPGTMSAPPFARAVVEVLGGNEVTLEAKGKLAQYVSLLERGELVVFMVDDNQMIVGVA